MSENYAVLQDKLDQLITPSKENEPIGKQNKLIITKKRIPIAKRRWSSPYVPPKKTNRITKLKGQNARKKMKVC